MTATLTSAPRVASQPKIREDWKDILKLAELEADPLFEWKAKFQQWIERMKEFRKMESELFFKHPAAETHQRMHRGWACSLISEGELLAVELLKVANDQVAVQLGFLDTFLQNLQSTVATWHGFDTDEEGNPLQ